MLVTDREFGLRLRQADVVAAYVFASIDKTLCLATLAHERVDKESGMHKVN